MKAAAAMTRDVVTIEPNQSLRDAHEFMIEWNIRHLPVVNGKKLVGILSDRDILLVSKRDDVGILVPAVSVSHVMTAEPMTCDMNTDISIVARKMLDNKIDSLPILTDGELVGLITSSDLLELLIEREQTYDTHKTIPFKYRIHRAGEEYAATA